MAGAQSRVVSVRPIPCHTAPIRFVSFEPIGPSGNAARVNPVPVLLEMPGVDPVHPKRVNHQHRMSIYQINYSRSGSFKHCGTFPSPRCQNRTKSTKKKKTNKMWAEFGQQTDKRVSNIDS